MLGWCWPIVYDAGPTSAQHWANTSCWLGVCLHILCRVKYIWLISDIQHLNLSYNSSNMSDFFNRIMFIMIVYFVINQQHMISTIISEQQRYTPEIPQMLSLSMLILWLLSWVNIQPLRGSNLYGVGVQIRRTNLCLDLITGVCMG